MAMRERAYRRIGLVRPATFEIDGHKFDCVVQNISKKGAKLRLAEQVNHDASNGLYERATGEDPFRLPEKWLDAKDKLDMETRFNAVATIDITGGNSGSPLIDKNGNLVGLAFDGNIHSIAGSYWFDEAMNRAVVVHPAIMMEALRVVYGANRLVQELEGTEPVTKEPSEMVLGSSQ